MKRQVIDLEKIIAKYIFEKEILSRIYAEHLRLN